MLNTFSPPYENTTQIPLNTTSVLGTAQVKLLYVKRICSSSQVYSVLQLNKEKQDIAQRVNVFFQPIKVFFFLKVQLRAFPHHLDIEIANIPFMHMIQS